MNPTHPARRIFMTIEPFRHALACAALGTAVAFASITAEAQSPAPLTPRSNVPAHDKLKQTYEIPNFRLGGKYNLDAPPDTWRDGGEGGTTLESLGAKPLKAAYIAVGTPRRNDKGEIVNAVVINSFYSGDATASYNFWYEGQPGNAFSRGPVVGPGRAIDTDKFYVVFVDAIGLWGASKPSDGLGRKFPLYNAFDQVQANYRLLRDHLKVAQVQLATGVSMGGTQTWTWGVMHSPSGFVRAIMPIGGATSADGDDPMQQWTFRLAQAALESDPKWRATGGDYYHLPAEQHPKQGLQFMWSVLQSTGWDFSTRSAQKWDAARREVFYWQPQGDETAAFIARTKNEDAVDYWYRNASAFGFNIINDLKRIKARTLVLHVSNDNWLMVANAERAAGEVKGAQFMSYPDPLAHYGVFRAAAVLPDVFKAFVEDRAVFGASGTPSGGARTGAAGPAKPAGLSK